MSEKWLPPIYWDGETVAILDQRLLPRREVVIPCIHPRQVISAIKTMAIRGAPAVGVAGALALALGARNLKTTNPGTFRRQFSALCERVKVARPTGKNLSWAVEKVHSVLAENPGADVPELQAKIRQAADGILTRDVADNLAIGSHGRQVVSPGANILTYCNAGALATADYGTALGVIRSAHAADPSIHVYSCETRPFLQGSRLTAYELMRACIPVTLITDNSVGSLMQAQKVDVVIVGADRIAANGDTANKIGTYMVAVLANRHKVPFYIAAPTSTIDSSIADGRAIPIEERAPSEVTEFFGRRVAPEGVNALNPAFDVTPGSLIAGIITEKGILKRPYNLSIRKTLKA